MGKTSLLVQSLAVSALRLAILCWAFFNIDNAVRWYAFSLAIFNLMMAGFTYYDFKETTERVKNSVSFFLGTDEQAKKRFKSVCFWSGIPFVIPFFFGGMMGIATVVVLSTIGFLDRHLAAESVFSA